MLKGFEAGVQVARTAIDTSRTGFIGHSFGGGAVPAVAWHYSVKKGWGAKGTFLFIMAPWYVKYFTQAQFESFPSHATMIVQVYEDEKFNDWRIAEDIFYSSAIPPVNKDFVIVHNDRHDTVAVDAEHVAPLSESANDIDIIDYYAIYRLLAALADYTFTGNDSAKTIALGNGAQAQRYMGTWPDGTRVTELTVTDSPVCPYRKRSYLFRWNRLSNFRRRHYTPVR
jgi:hypothetical protein